MIGQINRLLFTSSPVRYRAVTANSAFFLKRFDSIFVRNMSLLLNKTLINGNWVSSETNEQLAVLNPVNGEIVGQVPDLNAADAQKALQAANDAFYSDEWTKLTAKDRSGLLKVCNTLCGVCGAIERNLFLLNVIGPFRVFAVEMVSIVGTKSSRDC